MINTNNWYGVGDNNTEHSTFTMMMSVTLLQQKHSAFELVGPFSQCKLSCSFLVVCYDLHEHPLYQVLLRCCQVQFQQNDMLCSNGASSTPSQQVCPAGQRYGRHCPRTAVRL